MNTNLLIIEANSRRGHRENRPGSVAGGVVVAVNVALDKPSSEDIVEELAEDGCNG